MPIDILCERCNKKIFSAGIDRVRDYLQANGEVCTVCQKKEGVLERKFDRLKGEYIKKFDVLLDEAKAELGKIVRELANDPGSDRQG